MWLRPVLIGYCAKFSVFLFIFPYFSKANLKPSQRSKGFSKTYTVQYIYKSSFVR